MTNTIQDAALDQIFREARTHRVWDGTPVTDEELHRIYELMKFGPTSANTTPGRYVFVRSPAAKERLLPLLSPGNVDKTRAAPVTVIVAYDTRFYEHLTHLNPNNPKMKDGIASMPAEAVERMAFQGSSLEGAYFIVAARAIGLDCGPMGGFDRVKVDAEFFPDGRWKSNFLINLGHGVPDKLSPRDPRLSFDEACQVL
jgi:3-hydroxypropanoate dehydrogenase